VSTPWKLKRREFIADLYAEAGQTYVQTVARINPGLTLWGPWTAGVAQNFEEYRYTSLRVKYLPKSATNITADLIFTFVYDAKEEFFGTRAAQLNYAGTVTTNSWKELTLEFDTRQADKVTPARYVRGSDAPTGTDLRFYDPGYLVYSVGPNSIATGTSFLGEVWVEYELELMKPRIHEDTELPMGEVEGYANLAYSAQPLGTANLNVNYNNPFTFVDNPGTNLHVDLEADQISNARGSYWLSTLYHSFSNEDGIGTPANNGGAVQGAATAFAPTIYDVAKQWSIDAAGIADGWFEAIQVLQFPEAFSSSVYSTPATSFVMRSPYGFDIPPVSMVTTWLLERIPSSVAKAMIAGVSKHPILLRARARAKSRHELVRRKQKSDRKDRGDQKYPSATGRPGPDEIELVELAPNSNRLIIRSANLTDTDRPSVTPPPSVSGASKSKSLK
jgi:hypothetical protein